MDVCCVDKACVADRLRARQAGVLRIALAINAAMFLVELVSGLLAGSMALLADSLDMLGDALVYGLSLYVVGKAPEWKARAASAKAGVMGFFALAVFAELVYKLVILEVPAYETMGLIGAVALAANAACFALLYRHRAEDINMRSVWVCSRNDLVANVGVLLAAVAVWLLHSPWPDIAVGAVIFVLFARSAWVVFGEARAALAPRPPSNPVQSGKRLRTIDIKIMKS